MEQINRGIQIKILNCTDQKSIFFKFDSAWKSGTSSPKNVISGFRSTGLMPWNPDSVNYNKLIDPETT